MDIESLLNTGALWTSVKSGILTDVCNISLALLFTCFVVRLAVVFLYRSKPFTAYTGLSMAFTLMVFAVIVSPLTYPVLCEVPMSVFNLVTGESNGLMAEAKVQVKDLFTMIALSEGENVSFFNPHQGANTMVTLFSLCLNLTAVIMFISLTLGPMYMLLCLVAGPLVIVLSYMLGKELIGRWVMLLLAAVFIQLAVGVAYTVISSGSLGAVIEFSGAGVEGSLELAANMIVLCTVLALAVPMIHGFMFSVPVFYVFPAMVGASAALYDWGVSLLNAYGFAVQKHEETIGA